jgi:hypothetical protein
MKSTIFALIMSLVSTSGAMAETLTALQAQSVNVKKAIIKTTGTGEFDTQIHVYAQVEFSNECMAPDQLVTTVVSRSEINTQLILGGINTEDRVCPAVYQPVRKTVLVHTIYSDIMPIVTVNGRDAKHQ